MPDRDLLREGHWRDSGTWVAKARRQGALSWSQLGRRVLGPLPEEWVGPLGRWLADYCDHAWAAWGRPDPFTVVVMSGDDGWLARAVLDAGPVCTPALRYVMVDPDGDAAGPPAAVAGRVPLESPAFLYPAAAAGAGGAGGGAAGHGAAGGGGGDSPPGWDDDDELEPGELRPARGVGPLVTYLSELPGLGDGPGALVAVGLISRLEFDLYESDGRDWAEIRLADRRRSAEEGAPVEGGAGDGPLEEIVVPLAPGAGAVLPDPSPPGRYRHPIGAVAWLRRTLPWSEAAPLAVVDALGDGRDGGVDLEALGHVRRPDPPGPRPVPGTDLSVVTWRLG
ncbi:MAG: hypothetical protein KGQ66_14955 [Acidobacteriota bacterium]|nr:hypothetical protein [Acidobacteriota bacterium]